MATGITVSSTSNLSSGQKIMVAQAIMANEVAQPDPDLVGSVRIPQGTKQYDILTHARLSDASALTEGTDLAQVQQIASASLSITPSEHGIIVTLSKRLIRRQGDGNIVGQAGQMIGNSLRRKMASDVAALYDGFGKSVGAASTALDIGYYRGAVAYLMTDNDSSYGPAPMPLVSSMHIESISDVLLDLTETSPRGTTTGFTDELIRRWWRGRDRLYGVELFHSGVISRDAGNDAKGCIMNGESALRLVIANDAEATEQRDESARLIEYGIFQEWGEGERADPHGVEMYFDAAATV